MKLSQRIERIINKLGRTGANFAVSYDKYIDPSDPSEAESTYHIHPDVHNPLASNVLRFKNLNDLEGYANARLEARKVSDDYADQFDCPVGEAAMTINVECAHLQAEVMREFWEELN